MQFMLRARLKKVTKYSNGSQNESAFGGLRKAIKDQRVPQQKRSDRGWYMYRNEEPTCVYFSWKELPTMVAYRPWHNVERGHFVPF